MTRIVPAFSVLCTIIGPALADGDSTLLTIELADGVRHYDRAALMELPATEITTTTPWTVGPQTLTGVPVADLLEHAGIESGAIHVAALNEYEVTLDVEALLPGPDGHGPIIAYLHNGSEMTVRDRGPLWLLWPFDAAPRFQTEVIYSASVWQLETIRHIPDDD